MIWTSLVMRYWKVWVPVLGALLITGTVYGMAKRIEYLKEDRDAAVYEHDRAMEENRQLVENAKKLNDLVIKRKQQTAKLERVYATAMERIKALSSLRPDVSVWLNTRIPDGVLTAISSYPENASSVNISPTDPASNVDSSIDGRPIDNLERE